MKTPDETKKGLECCSQNLPYPCFGCPYERDEQQENAWRCDKDADALTYIQQLERENKDLLEERELNDCLRDKAQQLEAQVPKWISVEERLPEEEERVLFFAEEPRLTIDTAYGWWVNTNNRYKITHWMPLPEGPKEG